MFVHPRDNKQSELVSHSSIKATSLLSRPMSELVKESYRMAETTPIPSMESTIEETTDSTLQAYEIQDMGLWVDKYYPKSFTHLLSSEQTNRQVLKAVKDWDAFVFKDTTKGTVVVNKFIDDTEDHTIDTRPSMRVILLAGPPGK
jgi:hypothetical protein